MFTNGQTVRCIDSDYQPTLAEGNHYTVREVGERGIRVTTQGGTPIRYEFANYRFEPVVAPVAEPACCFDYADGILVVNGVAYEVEVDTNMNGGHTLTQVERLA